MGGDHAGLRRLFKWDSQAGFGYLPYLQLPAESPWHKFLGQSGRLAALVPVKDTEKARRRERLEAALPVPNVLCVSKGR